MRTRWLSVTLLALTACTVEQGKVPEIDELVLPESATLDADGTYHVDGTISYHDEDDAVARIRVRIASIGAAADYPAPGGKSATRAALPLRIVGTAPKGPTVITVTVLDVERNISDPKTATVTLK